MSDNARRIGALSMVAAGSSCVWSSTRRGGYDHDQPIGGVVMSIDDKVNDDGEIERWFVCLDPYETRRITVHRISENEVDQLGVEGTDNARAVRLLRRLAKELGDSRHALLSTIEARYVGWMSTLAHTIYNGSVGLTPAGGLSSPQVPQDRGLSETSSPTTGEARPGDHSPLAAPPSLPPFTEDQEVLAGPEFRDAFLAAAKGLSAQEVAVIITEATGGRYDAKSGRPWKVGLAMVTKDEAPAALRRLQAALVTA